MRPLGLSCVFVEALLGLACGGGASGAYAAPPEALQQHLPQAARLTERPDEGHPDESKLMAIPFASYGPETGWLGGAATLWLFHLDSDRNSRVGASVRYTEKSQLLLRFKPEFYWGDNHVKLDLKYDRFPDFVWGVGRGTAESLEEKFLPISTRLEMDADRRIWRRWFLGTRTELGYVSIDERVAGGFVEQDAVGGEGGLTAGLGLQLFWDDRDNANATTRGSYLKIGALRFDDAWGSEYDFTRYLLDGRHFFNLGGDQLLALQVIGLHADGDAPFYELSRIGGKKVLRGFYQGRYRDNTLLAFQAEYRRPLFWRLGVAAFGGVADVAPTPSALSFEAPKWAIGGGLRFAISRKSRLNARLDVGYGEGETATYLTFSEAF